VLLCNNVKWEAENCWDAVAVLLRGYELPERCSKMC
jgi:hypothetical protein